MHLVYKAASKMEGVRGDAEEVTLPIVVAQTRLMGTSKVALHSSLSNTHRYCAVKLIHLS